MINDLFALFRKENIRAFAYADDVAVVTENKNLAFKAIQIMKKWCQTNSMQLNLEKSAVLIIRANHHK